MSLIQTDILIIGTGAAGIAAAVAGQRSGLSIVVADKAMYPGGKATHAEVGTICGLYKIGRNILSSYVVKGFAVEFAEALAAFSGTRPVGNQSGLHFLPYQTAEFEQLCKQYLNQANIQYLPGCEVIDIEFNSKRIDRITLNRNGQKLLVMAKTVIDCSGIGLVTKMTNGPLIQNQTYMGAARVFRLGGLKLEQPETLNFIWIKALKEGIASGELSADFNHIYLILASFMEGEASFKIALPMEVTLSEPNLKALNELGELMVSKIVEFLKNRIPAFKDARLIKIADETGIRVETRPVGKYVLTETDVLNGKSFTDTMAKGAWPIEIWDYSGKVQLKFMEENKLYDIPAGVLQSSVFENLFFAGRGISADEGAIASARVMGTCLQTGYAAGVLAAHLAVNKTIETGILKIQKEQL